jgi:2-isopropylmalate synthase
MPFWKYAPFPVVALPDRQWPNRVISAPPIWCSVDLRDGNQALVNPMNPGQKQKLFDLLVAVGFKEIEVGFPAASQDDFDFARRLITEDRIPADVTIQVLVQAREHLIQRTFEALRGVRRAIVHLYNSTSPLQRDVVFQMSRREIIELARAGVRDVRNWVEACRDRDGAGLQQEWRLEYSPESFSATEPEFALEICHAVMDVWQPTRDHPIVLNLPATVEMSTPNVYADQIEWFGRHIRNRDHVILSVHAHNDRGTAVAATELALMAGADRVEGTLFGNGERTGNVDVLTVAMNMLSQGINPGLDFSDMQRVVEVYQECSGMAIHERHPYAGELVFTAFSGSHQDAIRKGMAARRKRKGEQWAVPYLPIDPADVGREYEPIIRINSQSGKSGVAFILEEQFGYRMPRLMQMDFSRVVQQMADQRGRELKPSEIELLLRQTYHTNEGPFRLAAEGDNTLDGLATTAVTAQKGDLYTIRCGVMVGKRHVAVTGAGNGPVSAFVDGLEQAFQITVGILDYEQHAMAEGRTEAVPCGSRAAAVTYVRVSVNQGEAVYGMGIHSSTATSAMQAVLNAVNRAGIWSDDEGAITIHDAESP